MIYIDRESVDENGDPIRPNDAWFDSAMLSTLLALDEQDQHVFDEQVYKHNEVRKALEKLFHDKCSYCEWKCTGGCDWDVEHFRPKGRVADRQDHPGYYWLAYEWSNLYISCTHCNQKRRDKPRWGDPGILPAAGKLDQFPLGDESTRVMSPTDNDSLRDEDTLLVDPCYDDPEDYLGFDLTGQIFSLERNPYGTKTIRIFNLKRRRLRDLRRDTVKMTVKILNLIRKLEQDGNDAAADDFRSVVDDLQSDSAQFCAVARYVVNNPREFNLT